MKIRHIFHTEEELSQRLGEPFVRKWTQLVEMYRSKKRGANGINYLRCASLAFAFYAAAVDGNAEVMTNFDQILHGQYHEYIMIDDKPMMISEDDLAGTVIWDTAVLMLDHNVYEDEVPQMAYDVADCHVCYAYKLSDDTPTTTPEPTPAPASHAEEPEPVVERQAPASDASRMPSFMDLAGFIISTGDREAADGLKKALLHYDIYHGNACKDVVRMIQDWQDGLNRPKKEETRVRINQLNTGNGVMTNIPPEIAKLITDILNNHLLLRS